MQMPAFDVDVDDDGLAELDYNGEDMMELEYVDEG